MHSCISSSHLHTVVAPSYLQLYSQLTSAGAMFFIARVVTMTSPSSISSPSLSPCSPVRLSCLPGLLQRLACPRDFLRLADLARMTSLHYNAISIICNERVPSWYLAHLVLYIFKSMQQPTVSNKFGRRHGTSTFIVKKFMITLNFTLGNVHN